MKIAAFTIVKNEKHYLPIWIKHYGKIVGNKNLYILDNGTTDGSTDNLKNVIKKLGKYSFDIPWLIKTVQDFQTELLKSYEVVIFSESDEIIVPQKKISDYILPDSIVQCTGYEIVHKFKEERTIIWNKRIMPQRNFWFKYPNFNKPLIASKPICWSPGFHTCTQPSVIDNTLTLIHLRRIDYEYCKQRLRERRTWKRPPGQNINWSFHWSLPEKSFHKWFYGVPHQFKINKIPRKYKNVI